MKHAKYDEFQLAKRHKIGYQSFILMCIIILVNGYVKSRYGVWADPFLESLVLMFLPGLYFSGASIWKNAYLRIHDNAVLILLLFGFVGTVNFLSLGVSIFSGTFYLIEDGQLGGDSGFVLLTSLFLMMFVLLLVRRRIDR